MITLAKVLACLLIAGTHRGPFQRHHGHAHRPAVVIVTCRIGYGCVVRPVPIVWGRP